MSKIDELVKERDVLTAKTDKRDEDIAKVKAERDIKLSPIWAETERVAKLEAKTSKPFDVKLRKLKAINTDDRGKLAKVQHQIDLTQWEGKVPSSPDETRAWLKAHCKDMFNISPWNVHPLKRVPKVKADNGLIQWPTKEHYAVIGMQDYANSPDHKAYVVFDPKGDVFAAMALRPAQHVGDYTTVDMVTIDGKDVKETLGLNVWAASKPLTTFMAAVNKAVYEIERT